MSEERIANVRKGEILVEFGSDARIIRLDFNAICLLEQNLEMPFHAAVSQLGLNVVREAMFVGIRAYGNNKTSRAEVGRMLTSGDQTFKYYAAIVLEAMQGPTGEDFSVAIDKLRASTKVEVEDEDGSDRDDDAQVEGSSGPDAGNQTPAQSA